MRKKILGGVMNRLFHLGPCFWVFLLFISIASPAIGQSDLIESLFRNDISLENEKFSGTWKESEAWEGWLCDGYYSYRIDLAGTIANLELEMDAEGGVFLNALLVNIPAEARGTYKSKATACTAVKSSVAIWVSDVFIRAHVVFLDEESNAFPDFELRILETKFGRIQFKGPGVPDWLQEFLTKALNNALNYVWETKLGHWISDVIAEEIKKKLP